MDSGFLRETVSAFGDNSHAFSQTVAFDLDELASAQTSLDRLLHSAVGLSHHRFSPNSQL